MSLDDYYFHDSRLILVPIEHLSPQGMSEHYARLIRARCGWKERQIVLFNRGYALYWGRSSALADRTRTWSPPRLRHVGIVREPSTVRPYAQILNTSCSRLYECDIDPEMSDPELVAYLLVHEDRMAM